MTKRGERRRIEKHHIPTLTPKAPEKPKRKGTRMYFFNENRRREAVVRGGASSLFSSSEGGGGVRGDEEECRYLESMFMTGHPLPGCAPAQVSESWIRGLAGGEDQDQSAGVRTSQVVVGLVVVRAGWWGDVADCFVRVLRSQHAAIAWALRGIHQEEVFTQRSPPCSTYVLHLSSITTHHYCVLIFITYHFTTPICAPLMPQPSAQFLAY